MDEDEPCPECGDSELYLCENCGFCSACCECEDCECDD